MDPRSVQHHPSVRRARRIVRDTDDETLADQLEAVRIPAPPFGEDERAAWVRSRLAELGLAGAGTDAEGNVTARLGGAADDARPVVVAAHLDTAFAPDTDLSVRRRGDRWVAPGIGDNARGLAALLALARALVRARVPLRRPVVLAATVGEEGAGDLRGVRHLFRADAPLRDAIAFIALEGAGLRYVIHRGLGVRRLRITARGPGGHSWADRGRASALDVLAVAAADLSRLRLPAAPTATASVGRMAGGDSVNSIPARAWLELDLRSTDRETLLALEERVRSVLAAARTEVNARRLRDTEPVQVDAEVIGDRPTGETSADAPLVRAAVEATRIVDAAPELAVASTDANLPMALGIPAVAVGAGGESGAAHTTDEWYVNTYGPEGVERALLTVAAAAGLRQ